MIMEIVLIGLSHKTSPVEIREKLALSQEKFKEALGRLKGLTGMREGLILSTCNRVEVLAVMEINPDRGVRIKDSFAWVVGMKAVDLAPYLYIQKGEAAVRHFFRVTASLDSMVLGEPQIMGQVKEAYRESVENKTTGFVLHKLFHRAFFVAKRVRSETKIASQAVSVSFAAVELAQKILGDLENKHALLIGAGEMSELATRHLLSRGLREISVTNRTYSRAQDLAKAFQGRAIPFEDFPGELKNVDIVLSSTGSAEFIIHKNQVAEVIRARKNQPMFFIDIAVPRDVDPQINDLDNVYVYNIDDLQGIIETNRGQRQREVHQAEEIVEQGVTAFNRWLSHLGVTPTIIALRQHLEKIRKRELDKTLALLKNPSEKEKETLETLTQAIVNKILHHPIVLLKKQEDQDHGKIFVEMTRKIFHLEEEDDESTEP
jgi:glutamyl-tRNA reductase